MSKAVSFTDNTDCIIEGTIINDEKGSQIYKFPVPQEIQVTGETEGKSRLFVSICDTNGSDYSIWGVVPEVVLNPEGVSIYLIEGPDGEFSMKCLDDNTKEEVKAWICVSDESGNVVGDGQRQCEITLFPKEIIRHEPPENIDPEIWIVEHTPFDDWPDTHEVSIVFDGNDIYIKNLWENLKDPGWIKGSIKEDKIIFETEQFLGFDKYNFIIELLPGGMNTVEGLPFWWCRKIWINPNLKELEAEFDNEKISVKYQRSRFANFLAASPTYGFKCSEEFTITRKPSGIEEIHGSATEKDTRCYDLFGRVLENPTKGTIYIKEGRKYIAR